MIWPATPTPYPPGEAFFSLPTDHYSLWNSTDWAIQTWHTVGAGQLLIQVLFLVAIIIAGVLVTVRAFEAFTRKDAES